MNLVEAPGTSHIDATVRRIILDVRLTTVVNFAFPPRPIVHWYEDIQFLVSAGVRGGAGDTYPDSLVDPDPKATLTAQLQPTIVDNSAYLGNQNQVITFTSRWSLDSAGIRHSPIAGQVPIGCASFSVIDPATWFGAGINGIAWDLNAWLRVLYRDP